MVCADCVRNRGRSGKMAVKCADCRGGIEGGPAVVDASTMWILATTFSAEGWLLLSAATGSGLLAMLYMLASYIRNQTYVHDLHIKVNFLRIEYQARLKELEEKAESGVSSFQEVEVPKKKAA